MAINPIDLNVLSPAAAPGEVRPQAAPGQGGSFWNSLQEALGRVDSLQQEASLSAQQLALGSEDFLHNTMIAYEKANLALQLTIEIRNRLVESYQEIMRMQM
ncbi:MAG TPA: flagellar hook-basal body complex protein FliE [Syntrophomonas sp.]|jgi:flagellar hook-basal body complex protein FliE|nr:flagellar hook-basal body complex protein FliE [Syntrophomonas sp.]